MSRRRALILVFVSLVVLANAQDKPPAPDQPSRQHREGRQFQGVAGTITAIAKNQITLKTMDGKTATISLSPETRYRKDGNQVSLADFKVGDMVMVGGDPAGENTWNARFVGTRSNAGAEFREGLGKRFIAGEIKSIDGTRLTILRPDGETQTIEVDENTFFRKQGESVTLADFKPGDHVFGRGELKNGTFFPTVLNLGDPRMLISPGESPQRR